MLAWLQRLIVLSVLATAAAWWAWSGQAQLAPGWQWFVLLLIALPHAPVLALEFVSLGLFGDPRPAPRPTWAALVRAWAAEVWVGVATFGWRQPFRARAIADHLPDTGTGRRGVVLVHGFVCNRGIWNPWMRRLREMGAPYVAVTLEPVFGAIDQYVQQIDEAVRRVHACTGQAPLVVAHSMGGLAARSWLRQVADGARCAGLVTIGSPHQGTWLARFAFSRNGRQMRRDSRWLDQLNGASPVERTVPFVCYFSHCDNIVFPAATATLPWADNRHLPGQAHVQMLFSRTLLDDVLRLLEPSGPDGQSPQ